MRILRVQLVDPGGDFRIERLDFRAVSSALSSLSTVPAPDARLASEGAWCRARRRSATGLAAALRPQYLTRRAQDSVWRQGHGFHPVQIPLSHVDPRSELSAQSGRPVQNVRSLLVTCQRWLSSSLRIGAAGEAEVRDQFAAFPGAAQKTAHRVQRHDRGRISSHFSSSNPNESFNPRRLDAPGSARAERRATPFQDPLASPADCRCRRWKHSGIQRLEGPCVVPVERWPS